MSDENKDPWGNNKNKNNNKPDNIIDIKDIISKKFQKNINNNGDNKIEYVVLISVLLLLFLIWLASGLYTVNAKEESVVLRFGKYVRTESSGLHYHLPSPVETIQKVRVTDRYTTEIGGHNHSSLEKKVYRSKYFKDDSTDILMLTGDENIVGVSIQIQWQIVNARKFIFNIKSPNDTIRNTAESVVREIIGTTPLNDTLSEKRILIQNDTKDLLQNILDSYDIGISIEEVNIIGVPPSKSITVNNILAKKDGTVSTNIITTTVDEAFKDVQAAIINKQEIINMAIARSNELIPAARGQAEKNIQEAKAYKEKIIAKAEGEAKRFLAVYNEYKLSKKITKKRIYIETMENIMEDMEKFIIDVPKGSVIPYLPLDKLTKTK